MSNKPFKLALSANFICGCADIYINDVKVTKESLEPYRTSVGTYEFSHKQIKKLLKNANKSEHNRKV